jgi:hypothetical protein
MPERHHYVPKLLLRNFSIENKLWLFDEHTLKRFRTNILNAFLETDYNTVAATDFVLEAEQIFSRAEAAIGPVIKDIIEARSVAHLTTEDRAQLALFVTIQHLRTKQTRRTFTLIREHTQQRFPNLFQ